MNLYSIAFQDPPNHINEVEYDYKDYRVKDMYTS